MILLTGFPPFGDEAQNPSFPAAERARDILRAEGHEVEAIELPCVFGESAEVLVGAIDRLQPDVVVSLGLAGGRTAVSLERVAINCDDARIPDNAGASRIDEPIVVGGPAAYFSSLPIKAALAALHDAGVPAEVSQTAGTYVCNHVFYALMHSIEHRGGVRGGFVHLPRESETMPLELMGQAVAGIVRTTLTTDHDAHLSAGSLH